jgi:hypothetical protein
VSGMDLHNVSRATARMSGLRANSFAAVVMLLIEYGLGTWVNLYGRLPASDHGRGFVAAFGGAVANGPVVLAVHALFGTLLLLTGISAVVRAAMARRAAWTAIGTAAFVAIVVAWFSGTRFVSDTSNSASFTMAIATAVAILGYAAILLVSAPTSTADAGRLSSERSGSY